MTDIMKLIDAVQREAENDGYKDRPMSDNTHEAKTMLIEAIEALQGEVEQVKGFWKEAQLRNRNLLEENNDLAFLADQYKAERDALQAKLDELQRQEPVGFVAPHEIENLREGYPATAVMLPSNKRTEPLYAAPKALEPSACSDFAKEYLSAWDDGMAGDSYLRRMAEAALKCDGITKGTP